MQRQSQNKKEKNVLKMLFYWAKLENMFGTIRGFRDYQNYYLKTREQEVLWYRFNKSLGTVGTTHFPVV